MVAEVGLQGRGVVDEGGHRGHVPELADGVEAAVPVGVEIPLDTGPGCSGETDDLGPGDSVGGQPEDLHPPLHLGRRVVEAVVRDLGQDGRGERQRSHGILPRRNERLVRLPAAGGARKAQSRPREVYQRD